MEAVASEMPNNRLSGLQSPRFFPLRETARPSIPLQTSPEILAASRSPDSSLTFGRPHFGDDPSGFSPTPKPRLSATRSRPYVRVTHPHALI